MTSFFKYYREKHDQDGERLWWPGGPDGYPFRGAMPPQTKQHEYENLNPVGKLRCRLFYLSKPEDLKDYSIIRDKCANGLFVPVDRDRVWDENTQNYRIFLEWLEMGYEVAPKENIDAIHNYIQQPQAVPLSYDKLAGLQDSTKFW